MRDRSQYSTEVFVPKCNVHQMDCEEEPGKVSCNREKEVEEDVEEGLVTEDHAKFPQVVLVVIYTNNKQKNNKQIVN